VSLKPIGSGGGALGLNTVLSGTQCDIRRVPDLLAFPLKLDSALAHVQTFQNMKF